MKKIALECYGPPRRLWPRFNYEKLGLNMPDQINICKVLLDENVTKGRGQKASILFGNKRITYNELLTRVSVLGFNLQKAGVQQGDRVALLLPNIPEFIESCLAIFRIGAICVPIFPRLKAREIFYILSDSMTKYLILGSLSSQEFQKTGSKLGFLKTIILLGKREIESRKKQLQYNDMFKEPNIKSAYEPIETSQDDICLLLYTSGTTGRPIGCIHTPREYIAVAECYGRKVLRISKDDVFGGSPSMAFAYGHTGLFLTTFSQGATLSLLPQFDAATTFDTIQKHKITVFLGVPTAFRSMLKNIPNPRETYNMTFLRVAVTAGEPCSPNLYKEWKDKTGVEMLEHLGSTEMFNGFISSRFNRIKPGSCGVPVPGYTIKVMSNGVDCSVGVQGELLVQGPTGTRYWRKPDKQEKIVRDGWNYTGDIVYIDEEGFVWHVGRSQYIIKRKAFRISPIEVEEAIREHFAISEVAVAGISESKGQEERIVALAVLEPTYTPNAELAKEILDFTRERIAFYKVPQEIRFIKRLPKTQSGKIYRSKLESML